jgi:hypothetical protein
MRLAVILIAVALFVANALWVYYRPTATRCLDCQRRRWQILVRSAIEAHRRRDISEDECRQIIAAEALAVGVDPGVVAVHIFPTATGGGAISTEIDPPDEGEEWRE